MTVLRACVVTAAVTTALSLGASIALFGDSPQIKRYGPLFFFDPMISNAYKEARGEPIIQGDGSPEPDVPRDTPPKPTSIHHES